MLFFGHKEKQRWLLKVQILRLNRDSNVYNLLLLQQKN